MIQENPFAVTAPADFPIVQRQNVISGGDNGNFATDFASGSSHSFPRYMFRVIIAPF
jgi:hypothetical protein